MSKPESTNVAASMGQRRSYAEEGYGDSSAYRAGHLTGQEGRLEHPRPQDIEFAVQDLGG
jgi:hypothetical protein